MKGINKVSIFLYALFCAQINNSYGDIIAQWTFNSVPPDGNNSTGTNVPAVGTGSASILGYVNASYSDGSTNDPASGTDDSGWATSHYPSQSTSNKLAGVQFNVSTVDYTNIVVRWDQRVTASASKYYRFEYSVDGSTFTDFPTPIVAQVAATAATYYEAQTNSLAGIPGVHNNPNFAFRIVSEWENSAIGSGTNGFVTLGSSYSTSGTVRFDYVTISGTLLPGANTPPTITSIGNQTIRVNQSTGPLSFTVLDADDPAASLTLNKVSSDASVISPANIVFGGSGAGRTVNVTSGPDPGIATITVWVIDSGGKSNSTAFVTTVLPANTAPLISAIPATNCLVNSSAGPLTFTVSDAETPAASLTLSGVSANPGLVPGSNISFGGSGGARTVTITPVSGQTGVAPVTVTVSDGTNSANSTFGVMVLPSSSMVFYDPFNYSDGSIITNSGFLWDNHTGTLGECQTVGGRLQISGEQTEDIAGSLAGGPYAKNLGLVLYASFKANFVTLPKATPDHFTDFIAGSSQRGRISAGVATNSPAGTFHLYVANGSDTNTVLAADLNTNTTYNLLVRYNIDTATTTLWLNPAAETDPGVAASDPQLAASISAFSFRQGSGLGATILVDDLKVGLSFASVTATNLLVSPIPLKIQRVSASCILTWLDPSFMLQSSLSTTGTFTDVLGASSPYTNPITGPAKFFRLRN